MASTRSHSLHADFFCITCSYCSHSPVFPQHEDYLPVHDRRPDQTLWDGLPSVACRPWIITAKHKARGLGSLSRDEVGGEKDILSLYSRLQGDHILRSWFGTRVKITQEKYMVWCDDWLPLWYCERKSLQCGGFYDCRHCRHLVLWWMLAFTCSHGKRKWAAPNKQMSMAFVLRVLSIRVNEWPAWI